MIGNYQAQGRCLQLNLQIMIIITIVFLTLNNIKQLMAHGEFNAIVGTNISLNCNTLLASDTVWWTKDGNNITDKNPRFIAFKGIKQGDDQNQEDFDDNHSLSNNNDELPIIIQHFLNITNIHINDTGNYTCFKYDPNNQDVTNETFIVQSIKPARIISHSPSIIRTKISQSILLYCVFEAHPIERYQETVKWYKDKNELLFKVESGSSLSNRTKIQAINSTHINVTLEVNDVFKKDNGSYVCSIESPFTGELQQYETSVLVLDVPQVSIDYVKAVGAQKIFLNWTINDGNDPVKEYFVQHLKDDTTTFTYYNHPIDGRNVSYVLDNFEKNTQYEIKITAKNTIGMGPPYTYPHKIKTLETDPIFIPQVSFKGNSHSTITVGWTPPPAELLEYIHYYELIVAEAGENSTVIEEAIHPQNSRNLPYMFDNLRTATEYKFKVRSCSELTKLCGNWSDEVTGTTMDGQPSEPLNLKVSCMYYNISGRTMVMATWDPPAKPNGNITTYHTVLDGLATFRSEKGYLKNETFGPKYKSIVENSQKADFENVPPNTNYTVRVSGVTRSKRPGEAAIATCTMPPTVPEIIGRLLWGKVETETGNWVFKLFLPQISERNGPICGYRIYLVRLGRQSKHLPPPENLEIMTYHEAHAANNSRGGAYIAEIISSDNFHSEIFLGDDQRIKMNETISNSQSNEACRKLLNGFYVKQVRTNNQNGVQNNSGGGGNSNGGSTAVTENDKNETNLPLPPISTQKERLDRAGNLTSEASKILNSKNRRKKRQHSNNSIPVDDEKKNLPSSASVTSSPPSISSSSLPPLVETIQATEIVFTTPGSISINSNSFEIYDGQLDTASNYTGFVEIIVNVDNDKKILSTFSEYFEIRTAGAPQLDENTNDQLSLILNIVTQVLCGLILLVLVLLIALYFWHRYSKNVAQGDEVISLRDSLSRAFCGGRNNHNHRHLIGTVTSKPADIGPIHKTDLPQAYVNRHKDTDYGFLREYEILPNRFNDRTTKHSDIKENIYKNRYPDIKAYDQTRVKLVERNGTIGSDYINANFVLGYKERKKFICAQGPMDSTVNDFWRMIWEQHLEIIVMLTNLEEYNKAKCAKYWPEKVDDSTKFGDITVTFTEEQRFSDYLIRDLRVTRRNVHNNGGVGIGGSTGSGSGGETDDEERRHITQYHYLVWKDFMAPEHPHGIIKFIRQINSVYSLQRGPILVHCSAGVGRTGTLVALDSLMQQLDDENQVSIFNTVCDMRHQRNFLVQSLKQYIFLYRALLDLAHFGNTELGAKDLSSAVENLKAKATDSKEQCKLEIEFKKLKAITDDTNKTCAVGNSDENRCKNRSDLVIPFDRNRVILTPIPSREHSTYINASFIEGYDNSESFIITQDPMEETIGDFWRMISEQGINTIVMISEIGDGAKKCPRYWADDEIQYDHILVKYMQSESCPYYTRREFNVTNCKMKDTIKVTQFQYNGWPTVEGEVPEVARGMIELVDQAQTNHNSEGNFMTTGPVVVHCNLGTDRSSIYVSMCILVQHLRTEKKVDICTTTRKLRSQRTMLLDSYSQYEFVHRAIVNYTDLHRQSLDLPSSASEC